MRRDKWLSCLIGLLLSFLLGCSGVLCLITGFSLEQVDIGSLLIWSVTASAACSLCFTWKLGLLPICSLTLLGVYLWREGTLAYSVEALVNRLSTLYSMGYKWPVIAWSGRELEGVDLTPALCAISLLVILCVSWTVCRRMPAILAVLVSALPVASCVVVTDTVPRAIWLFVYLLALSVLLLSQLLRCRSATDGNRITAIFLAPVLLGLGLLFALLPQEGYGQFAVGTMGDAVSDWVEQVLTANQGPSYVNVSGGAVNLGTVGSRKESEATVMEVTADYTGTVYLRSYAYDTYFANYWTNGGENGSLPWAGLEMMQPLGEVRISTRYAHPKLYLPYYCEGLVGEDVGRGRENWTDEKNYGYTLWTLAPNSEAWEDKFRPSKLFTTLPEDTQEWAREMVDRVAPEQTSATRIANAVRRYVSACAEYDLDARRMPSRFSDFAHWFLTEADEGYCVHFATAAAVLMRAAGVPTRYVTGYLVQTEAGQPVAVKGKNAHAWVEYWADGIGWQILEATPPERIAQIAQVERAEPTQPTEQTEATEETTVASEETEENTKPTEKPQNKPVSIPKKPVPAWKTAVAVIGGLVATVLAVLLQWRLRLWLRRRRRKHGRINGRIVAAWRESVYLARLLGEKPDKGLFALAQKAKFSQYILNEETLRLFEDYILNATEKLRKKPLLLRLVYRLVFAAY